MLPGVRRAPTGPHCSDHALKYSSLIFFLHKKKPHQHLEPRARCFLPRVGVLGLLLTAPTLSRGTVILPAEEETWQECSAQHPSGTGRKDPAGAPRARFLAIGRHTSSPAPQGVSGSSESRGAPGPEAALGLGRQGGEGRAGDGSRSGGSEPTRDNNHNSFTNSDASTPHPAPARPMSPPAALRSFVKILFSKWGNKQHCEIQYFPARDVNLPSSLDSRGPSANHPSTAT